MNVFVYGTLLPGLRLHALLAGSIMVDHGFVEDCKLYDLGDYPALVEGEGRVVGEIYDIPESILDYLDRVEGYDPKRPQYSLYIRRQVTVWGFAGEVFEAETYVYNDQIAGEAVLITDGDYRRYLTEVKPENPVWLVAYGSNMSRRRLERRVGLVNPGRAFRLAGYALRFNKEHARANLMREPGASAPVVAWMLNQEQRERLDAFEGTPEHYLRVGITVQREGKSELMQMYLAHPDRLEPEGCPEPPYLEHILTGYREHGYEDRELLERLNRCQS